MLKPITFRLKEAYGRTRAYPVSDEAVFLTRLTGCKTLTPEAIPNIAGLGFECVDQLGETIHPSDLY